MTPSRTAALALALAVPFAGAAGCGIVLHERASIESELTAAGMHLDQSKSLSVTFRVTDPRGDVVREMLKNKASARDIVLAKDSLGSTLTFTINPAGQRTLAGLSAEPAPKSGDTAALVARVKEVNADVTVKVNGSALTELRLVNGTLYSRFDVGNASRLAADSGNSHFDADLNKGADSAGPEYVGLLADVRAGKWIRLPLTDYLKQFADLARSFPGSQPDPGTKPDAGTPTTPRMDPKRTQQDLLAALKPYVTITDANNSSSDRVLNVRVKAAGAASAVTKAFRKDVVLPGVPGIPAFGTPGVPDPFAGKIGLGTVNATVTLHRGHLRQIALDLGSVVNLDPKPKEKLDLTGMQVIVDVNDNAPPVIAPTDLAAFDLAKLIRELLSTYGAQTSPGSVGSQPSFDSSFASS